MDGAKDFRRAKFDWTHPHYLRGDLLCSYQCWDQAFTLNLNQSSFKEKRQMWVTSWPVKPVKLCIYSWILLRLICTTWTKQEEEQDASGMYRWGRDWVREQVRNIAGRQRQWQGAWQCMETYRCRLGQTAGQSAPDWGILLLKNSVRFGSPLDHPILVV